MSTEKSAADSFRPSLTDNAAAGLERAESWSLVIRPQTKWWDLHLHDIWRYRDLLWLLTWRDFAAVYKQTILGPLWWVIQPLLTTIIFTVIFSGIANIPTDGLPPMLFYLAGVTAWNYFASCLTRTSSTFISNAALFGKVYFPRLIAPISVALSNLVQFAAQFLLFVIFLVWFALKGVQITPDFAMISVLTPALLVLMGLLGLGMGIIISSLTTKYRDLAFLVTFGVQLAMYATPIIYPMSAVPEKYRWILEANPMSPIIESFRAIYLGGQIPWDGLGVSLLITVFVLALGILLFNRVEKTFMDTV